MSSNFDKPLDVLSGVDIRTYQYHSQHTRLRQWQLALEDLKLVLAEFASRVTPQKRCSQRRFSTKWGFFNGPYMQSFITQVNLSRPGMNHSVDFIIFKYILRELAC